MRQLLVYRAARLAEQAQPDLEIWQASQPRARRENLPDMASRNLTIALLILITLAVLWTQGKLQLIFNTAFGE